MRELLIAVDKSNDYLLGYIHDKIAPSVKSVGGLCALSSTADRSKLGVAVCDECFTAVNKELKSFAAEILAIGYKNKYLKNKINIESDSLLGKTLLNTMCVFDSNYDTNLIKRRITDLDFLSLDGCYNFRLREVKRKWDEVAELSNSYSGFLADKEVLYEFLSFLLDAIPTLSDVLSVVLADDLKDFQIFSVREKLLNKFTTFPSGYDIREQILFNLICFNPNLVRFCGRAEDLGQEFNEIANELFNIKEGTKN